MKHYLLSLPVPGGYLHGYFMASNDDPMQAMSGKMMKVAEDCGIDVQIPLVLATELSKESTRRVRDLVVATAPDKGATLRAATNFHVTIFGMSGDNPDNAWLVDLH